ncbi:MAG: 2Fe-2S iron-sulfur cluster-binding protein [Candidatus Dormibacteraeota bacterium]|nr:2Fe-2S iron-sulfur cluster-binding protein [Candidatus Dormibacteraeota bacterium]
MKRLPSHPSERLNRASQLALTMDGRPLNAFEGDTIGSAMAANGVTVTGRSFKYHRPRGLRCMTGACANCLVTVDGVPNVRACLEPARDGMTVRRQNAWPSVDRDLLGVFDLFAWALPAGFYYKAFHRPRFLWPLVEPIIRQLAGLGRVPETVLAHNGQTVLGETADDVQKVYLHPDVLVIGGGRAGLSAAIEVANAGKNTVLLEGRPELGGRTRSSGAYATAASLVAEAEKAGIRILLRTAALGAFEGGLILAASHDRLFHIRPKEIVIATGSMEQVPTFPNNDLPGIMTGEAVDRLLHLYRILPGSRAVVAAYGPTAQETAGALRAEGAEVTVIDPTTEVIEAALGHGRLRGIVLKSKTGTRQLACDLLVVGGLGVPAAGLVPQMGGQLRFDKQIQALVAEGLPSHIRATGAVTGASRTSAIVPPASSPAPGKQFTCTCMDVTKKEMEQAVVEGFDDIELLKRYTTVSMGPCQGKSCLHGSRQLTAALTKRTLAQTATTTSRPPWVPVSLGVLAAGSHTPRKETAMHDRHVAAGAEFLWAGDWRRPHHYQDPREECRAVHERVGLIDVSSLGKFRIKGPQVVTLLERLYPSRLGDLKMGRIRYGAMLNDQGVILDDGTLCRLAEDEFFVTTTTGGTAGMEQWMRWWLADWGLDVQLLNVSGGYAAVNLAGPLSRRVMERLTDLDVSAAALPYLSSARGTVAGVPALILRIGFVGELSYEIHVPSAFGEHVWDAIMDAGKEHGIAAFGLEAQRILRLEKQHIIVGQDTDALSTPYGAGLNWMVKLEKPDFLGRASLQTPDTEERLVGFTLEGGEVPPEGASIVEGDRPVGRVTSSRWSGIREGGVGMAWLPTAWAENGRAFEIVFSGKRSTGKVHLEPFYDPKGERLRS